MCVYIYIYIYIVIITLSIISIVIVIITIIISSSNIIVIICIIIISIRMLCTIIKLYLLLSVPSRFRLYLLLSVKFLLSVRFPTISYQYYSLDLLLSVDLYLLLSVPSRFRSLSPLVPYQFPISSLYLDPSSSLYRFTTI